MNPEILPGNSIKRCSIKPITLAFICLFAVSIYVAAQQSPNCLAVVTEMSGEVLVLKYNSKKYKADWGTQLFEGDKIKTLDGSKVSLLFSNGNLINLGANSNIEIANNKNGKSELAKKPKKLENAMMANFSVLTLKRDNEKEVGVLAGLRAVNSNLPVELISPCNTLIKATKPAFSWETNKSMDEYKLSLYNSKGLVWSKKVTDNKLIYPSDEEALKHGESYFWHVEGEVLLESYKSLNQEFTILSTDEISQIIEQEESIKSLFSSNPNSGSYHSVLGAYYMNIGLLEDAIEEFRLVSEVNPETALPHEILGKLYADVGKKDLAIMELQKALQLAKKEE